jgi:hypothetical protein
MSTDTLYTERRFSLGIFLILSIIALLMASFLIAQLVLGPLGSKPAPTWLLALLTGLFLLPAANFAFLSLRLTPEGVTVAYGLIRSFRRWEDLNACELDTFDAFYGWGVRFGKYREQWVWIYNTIGGGRVAFLTKSPKPRGLIVSTANPEKVVGIARDRIQR